MKEKHRHLFLLVAMSVVICGCATRKEIVDFKQNILHIRQQIEEARTENAAIKAKLDELGKSVANMQDETRRTRAELLTELMNLKNQTLFLDNKLEDTSYRMNKLLHRTEAKVLQSQPTDSINQSEPTDSTLLDNSRSEDLTPKALYDAAYLDFSKGNHDLALDAFKKYLAEFPQSEFADNAQYWLGEIHYAAKNYRQALDEFQKVVVNYPTGEKVPAAILKIGYCRVGLNDVPGARRYLEAVIRQFPHSAEADLARQKLSEIIK